MFWYVLIYVNSLIGCGKVAFPHHRRRLFRLFRLLRLPRLPRLPGRGIAELKRDRCLSRIFGLAFDQSEKKLNIDLLITDSLLSIDFFICLHPFSLVHPFLLFLPFLPRSLRPAPQTRQEIFETHQGVVEGHLLAISAQRCSLHQLTVNSSELSCS